MSEGCCCLLFIKKTLPILSHILFVPVMLLESLESRNLLAGDGDLSQDVDFAEAGLAIAKDAAIGAVHGGTFFRQR